MGNTEGLAGHTVLAESATSTFREILIQKATLCQGVSVFSSINMPHGRWEEREPVGCLIGLSLTENG